MDSIKITERMCQPFPYVEHESSTRQFRVFTRRMPNWVNNDRVTLKGRYLLVSCIILISITLLYLNRDVTDFAVVVDAGSSGSRCHIYSYQQTGFLPEISQIDSIKTQPGISSLEDITEIGPYLSEILEFVTKKVPKALHSKTPILFYATAGMRLLPISTQQNIMKSCCAFFKNNSEFHIPNCQNFRVITGYDEGIYGWLTVNYLKNTLSLSEKVKTFGFLDMGGASLQIAFQPNHDIAIAHQDDLSEIKLFLIDGSIVSYKIFVTTYLGFGANEARKRYLELKKSNSTGTKVEDDCLLNGHNVIENGIQLEGTGNYLNCIKKVSVILNNGMPCPDNPCYFNGVHIPISNFSALNLIGVSEFWYTSTNVYNLGGLYNSSIFLSKFNDLCSSSWNSSQSAEPATDDSPSFVEYHCFKSSWIYNFLHLGLRLSTQQYNDATQSSLEFVDKIGNVEVSWTLGAILMAICSDSSSNLAIISLRHWHLGLIFLLFCFVLLFCASNCSRKWIGNSSSVLPISRPNFFERRRKSSGDFRQII